MFGINNKYKSPEVISPSTPKSDARMGGRSKSQPAIYTTRAAQINQLFPDADTRANLRPFQKTKPVARVPISDFAPRPQENEIAAAPAPKRKLLGFITRTHSEPNLPSMLTPGPYVIAPQDRHDEIVKLKHGLLKQFTYFGFTGITWGATVGAAFATAAGVAIPLLAVEPLVPGLGSGICLAIFLGFTVAGVVAQWRKHRTAMGHPKVKEIGEKLDQLERDILAIAPESRSPSDDKNLRDIRALKARMQWTFKQCLRQMAFGIFGNESSYTTVETSVKKLYQKIASAVKSGYQALHRTVAALGARTKAAIPPWQQP